MALRPRRLPARFNRRVGSRTRQLVQQRHGRRRALKMQRLKRNYRKFESTVLRWFLIARRYFWWAVGGVIVLIIGIVLFSPLLHVRQMAVDRNEQRLNFDRVQTALAPLFGRHLLLLNTSDVLPLLRGVIPDLESVSIEKRYPSSFMLHVELQPIIARLDIEGDEEATITGTGSAVTGTGSDVPVDDGASDFLTSSGIYVRYASAYVQSGAALPLLSIVDWGARPAPGTRIFDPALVEQIAEAETALRTEFQDTVRSRDIYIRAREFHLQTATYQLWFDDRSSVREQLDRYRLFIETAGKGAASQYVDLRLKDKLVYR